jgi:TolB-like protein/class 3 adenylate cyclase/Tfp pilus assembly protein PilF
MATEENKETELEIGHVLFIDIVGYSKLLIEDQKERLRQLTEVVLQSAQVREAPNEQLVRLPTGDGMGLVFRNSVQEPARCALEVAEALKKHPELQVRMGIHSGPVSEVTDVSGRQNLAGTGINVAQRVMDCGDAGHILLSKRAADDLSPYRQWSMRLHDLGECEVKHGVRLHLFNLHTEEAGNAALPARLRKPRRSGRVPNRPQSRLPRKQTRRWLLPTAAEITAVFAVAFLLWWLLRSGHSKETARFAVTPSSREAASVPEKSVAVLPFENLSEEKANAYFADGVQDEILTDLAKVADLKVISRTSVIAYRDTAGRNLRKIGQELGVAHVLEGSVQRAGHRVRINAQLIDARNDAHLWAQTYDRDLADVFAIQSEIAKTIADQLQAKLSPNERKAIEQPPTTDLAAFDLYSRAKSLLLTANFSATSDPDTRKAIDLLDEAVKLDPSFFDAYCQLARAHEQRYAVSGIDHTPARQALAEAAVDAAARLRPDTAETQLVHAQYLYFCRRDYAGALAELERAHQILPNDPRLFELTGYVLRRRGQPEEGLRNLQRAVELDPRNFFILQQIAISYVNLRRYADAIAALDRALSIVPDNVEMRVSRAEAELYWKGDTRPLHRTIDSILAQGPDAISSAADLWFMCALAERDPAAAERALVALGNNPCWGDNTIKLSHSFGQGLLALMTKDEAGARTAFEAARAQQEKIVQAQPEYGPSLCVLALIDAALGRKELALEEGRRAIALTPLEKDIVNGSQVRQYFAITAAWAGEKELALEQLETGLRAPTASLLMSYGALKLLPYWDPLRGDSRFEKIVASLTPKD